MHKLRRRLYHILISIIFLASLLEIGIRIIGSTDNDGQFYFQGIKIRPYLLPIQKLEERLADIEEIEAGGTLRTFIYDPMTGWVPRPDHKSVDGMWTSNSVGIRANREYELEPAAGILRIALFGGSFTAGDEVDNDEMWATVLENALTEQNIQTEVINFGVNAYGTDQAYLRWQHLGKDYKPDLVIVGFLPENTLRNVNIIRPIYLSNANMLYSKPRFILNDENKLELLNQPTILQSKLADVMRQFPDHPLAPYEYHYQRMTDYGWWLHMRLFGVIDNIINNLNAIYRNELPDFEREAYTTITDEIVSQFAIDVADANAAFMVAYLPGNIDVRAIGANRELSYQPLLDKWQKDYDLIHVSDTFEKYALSDWMIGGHYSPQRNLIVGKFIAAHIETCLHDETCQPPRFRDEQPYWIED